MLKLALIGKDISHSLSPRIYKEFDKNIRYDLIDIKEACDLPELPELFKKYNGISITAPYKCHFKDKVDILEPNNLNAVNTIKMSEGRFVGVLTDLLAFDFLFTKYNYNQKKIILLGSGVMANMVADYLEQRNITYIQMARSLGNLNTKAINSQDNELIINTCAREFKFEGSLSAQTIFWDFNYLLEHHGHLLNSCQYRDGLELLRLQARFALDFFKSN